MSELALPALAPTAAYPEQALERPGLLDRIADRIAGPAARRLHARRVLATGIVAAVQRYAKEAEKLNDAGIKRAAAELRLALRRDGFAEPVVAQSFALVREVAGRTLGMRHFDSQLQGGWILLNGMVAEMETGEGKTLTATLPACTAALAGLPVHVITVNDYLTARDAELMGPVYRMLGLSVGVIVNGKEPAARRAAYACDITYCTNKELTFDYLRDRTAVGAQVNRIQLSIERLAGGENRASRLVLRGLFFAIVDEADSVLCDEARTPLILAARSDQGPERSMYEPALTVAARLKPTEDFVVEGASGRSGSRRRRNRSSPGGPRRCRACSAGRAGGRSWSSRRSSRRTSSSAIRTISSATTRSRSSTSTPGGSCPTVRGSRGCTRWSRRRKAARSPASKPRSRG